MARLEYRSLDEGYPVLYFYEAIALEEIAARFSCDYLVKGDKVYEKTSCAVEGATHVIYVKPSEDEEPQQGFIHPMTNSTIRIEIRQYHPNFYTYPILENRDVDSLLQAALLLQSDWIYVEEKEWMKSSTEVDEDRKVYVCYVKEAESDEGNV